MEDRTDEILAVIQKELPRVNNIVINISKHAIQLYYASKSFSRKQSIAELKRIVKACEDLILVFSETSQATHSSLQYFLKYQTEELGNLEEIDLMGLIEKLKSANKYISYYANIPIAKGRPTNIALNELLKQLASVYEYSTGKLASKNITSDRDHKEYKGDFFDFVVSCLKAEKIKYHSKTALGGRIVKALKSREKTYERAYEIAQKKSQLQNIELQWPDAKKLGYKSIK